MEDIQDGIKVSIQDGKEDIILPDLKGKSTLGLIHAVVEIANPQFILVHKLTTDSLDQVATLTLINALAVV